MKEKFVTLKVNGVDTDYAISNYGRILIKSNRKEKSTFITNKGYEQTTVQINKVSKHIFVHRAVYESFKGAIPIGMQINHIDGNKLNNTLSNLEVVTPQENIDHSWHIGLRKVGDRAGELNPNCKHNENEAVAVYQLICKTTLTHKQIAELLNLDFRFVKNVAEGMWADVTGYNKEAVKRNYKFTEAEELILWYLYRVKDYKGKKLAKIMGIEKGVVNNKINYINRNKKDKMDKKIQKPKVIEMVQKFLGGSYKDDDEYIDDNYYDEDDIPKKDKEFKGLRITINK